jgi:hypothetical protein
MTKGLDETGNVVALIEFGEECPVDGDAVPMEFGLCYGFNIGRH